MAFTVNHGQKAYPVESNKYHFHGMEQQKKEGNNMWINLIKSPT
jgi:hypothetical protein